MLFISFQTDLKPVHQLSRIVYEWEDQDFDEEAWLASAHPLDSHALEHPDVTEFAAEHSDGPAAALAYLAEGDTRNAPKIIRWMMAGAFKGHFATDADFCRDQFEDAIEDHFATWGKRADLGMPEVEFAELIDWDEVAYKAVGGPVMDTHDQVFYSIAVDSGVYVFDVSIDIDDYLGED